MTPPRVAMTTSSIELVRHPQFLPGAMTPEFDPTSIGVEGTIRWSGPATMWPDT
jgi:hypothetical protein